MHRFSTSGNTAVPCQMAAAILLVLFIIANAFFLGGLSSASAQAPTPAANAPEIVQMTSATLHTETLSEAVPSMDLQPGRASYPGCLDRPEIPVVDYATDNLPLTDIVFIATCGWQPDETITVTLMDPRGKITTSTVKVVPSRHLKDVYEADVFYQPGVDMPEGKYRFTLTGNATRQEGGTVKAKLTFNKPTGARMYVQSPDPFQPFRGAMGGQQQLRLAGFLPREPVRLLVYQLKGTVVQYYGWQDFTTDRRGQLIIATDLKAIEKDAELAYYAYARETHFVQMERFTRDGYSISRQFDMDLYCPGAQAPRFNGSGTIHAATGVAKTEIHKQPGFGSQLAATVPGDAEMRLFGYPKCIDHAYWWKVSLKKPILFGWVAESYLGKYQVELLKPVK